VSNPRRVQECGFLSNTRIPFLPVYANEPCEHISVFISNLKVHKRENVFGSDFEIFTFYS
jgi:hypothetical protein